MKFKGYGPIIVLIALLAILTAAQGILSRMVQPEMFQSQVSGAGTALQDVRFFDLEIKLVDEREIEMRYQALDSEQQMAEVRRDDRDQPRLSGDEAIREVQLIIESAPALSTTEPLGLIQGILDQLAVHQGEVKEFELEYALGDDQERSIELEVDKDDKNG